MGSINLVCIGDVVGNLGIRALEHELNNIKAKYNADFCIVNGENSHEGRGISPETFQRIINAGADVITGGDHSFDRQVVFDLMKVEQRLLRPVNYPKGVYGQGYGIYETYSGYKIAVANIRGRVFFHNFVDCPFRAATWFAKQTKQVDFRIIDFHAEATAEKIALAWHLDGKVSGIFGTHTHVQTNDAQVFPAGTGYISDLGFTGSHNSIIGMEKNVAINRFVFQTPHSYRQSQENNMVKINGVVFTLDVETGMSIKSQAISVDVDLPEIQEEELESTEV